MKTDSMIQAEVMEELKWDPSVQHEHIGVTVLEGIVTLSGTVPTYIEKFAADKAALRVGDVRAVVEKIEVKMPDHSKRDDSDIVKAILTQFRWHVQIPDDGIKVSVENGVVSLSGEVEWQFQRQAAERAIKGLAGINGIFNKIVVKPSLQPQDIKKQIEKALQREAKKDSDRISVAVQGSKVTLTGRVQSMAESQEAKWAAWCAPGVTVVENKLLVNANR